MDPFKPDVEPSDAPAWMQRVFHWFMMGLLLAIIFAVSGSVGFLILYTKTFKSLAMQDTSLFASIRFVGCGVLGLASFSYLMRRKMNFL